MPDLYTVVIPIFIVVIVGYVFIEVHAGRRDAVHRARQPPPLRPPHVVEREQQLKALYDAVPTTPPERMRATIHINRISTFTLLTSNQTGRLERSEVSEYSVDMILELPERDRALITQEHLDQVPIDEIRVYSDSDILNIMGERDLLESRLGQSYRSRDHVALRVMQNEGQPTFTSYRDQTRQVRLGEYLQVPFCRSFNTKPEANDYADNLREKTLPYIRKLIDKAASRDAAPSATIEF